LVPFAKLETVRQHGYIPGEDHDDGANPLLRSRSRPPRQRRPAPPWWLPTSGAAYPNFARGERPLWLSSPRIRIGTRPRLWRC